MVNFLRVTHGLRAIGETWEESLSIYSETRGNGTVPATTTEPGSGRRVSLGSSIRGNSQGEGKCLPF